MPKRLISEIIEEFVLFTSVTKWLILATLTGIIVGASTTFFLKTLEFCTAYMMEKEYYYFLLPIAMFVSSLIVKYLASDAEGHGTEKVIEAIHKRAGKINVAVIPVKFIATVITVASGGSVGKEGPCAQIGGGVSSILADVFRFDDDDRKKLVICGISTGFSTVFGTPIAGAIFGIEVLFIGNLFYDALFPSFVAGMIGYQVARVLGVTYFYRHIEFVPVFSGPFFLEVVLAGIFFGLCSFLMIEVLESLKTATDRLRVWKPAKGLVGGLVLVFLALLFSQRFLGLGLETIRDALEGRDIGWHASFMKMIFTSVTLNFGGSGGIVTPIFFVGSTAGSLFADIAGADRATFAAIGLVALLAGAANTPIAASIMSVELFGPKIAPYAAIACIVSYLITGHRSVYPSQIVVRSKSSSVYVESGKEIEDIAEIKIRTRPRTLITILLWISDTITRGVLRLLKRGRRRK